MIDPAQIRAHAPVLDSEGQEFATVDRVEDAYIKLTKDEQGQHHWIPLSWVRRVDSRVHIDRPSDVARRDWLTTQPAGVEWGAGGIGGTQSGPQASS